jgi:hypothetical protein
VSQRSAGGRRASATLFLAGMPADTRQDDLYRLCSSFRYASCQFVLVNWLHIICLLHHHHHLLLRLLLLLLLLLLSSSSSGLKEARMLKNKHARKRDDVGEDEAKGFAEFVSTQHATLALQGLHQVLQQKKLHVRWSNLEIDVRMCYVLAYVHACIHTCMHTYIHACVHIRLLPDCLFFRFFLFCSVFQSSRCRRIIYDIRSAACDICLFAGCMWERGIFCKFCCFLRRVTQIPSLLLPVCLQPFHTPHKLSQYAQSRPRDEGGYHDRNQHINDRIPRGKRQRSSSSLLSGLLRASEGLN